jgi:glycine C-acetyltransferase
MNPTNTISPPPVRHFENFLSRDGSYDLFHKIEEFEVFMRESQPGYVSGLGLQMLGAVRNQMEIREKDGREHEVIMMGSNSYLALNTHPRVTAASQAASEKFGYGMGSVSLLAGTSNLHRALERTIADFYGAEEAILFPCGYSGNVGLVAALCGPGDVIINDSANHASIFDGCKLSGAEVKVYLHNNMRHLEKLLAALPASQKGRLIITDGVFSMDGDIAPLDEIVALAEKYGARVMIDEAHALGVIGQTGRGTAEHFGLQGGIDVTYGTLSKAPAAIGGYCVGSAKLIQYLRYYARSYVFSSSIPASVAAGLIEAFKLMGEDQAGRESLWKNINHLVAELKEAGFDTGETHSAIIPIIVGDEVKLSELHHDLREEGVFTSVVTYPAVRRKECRLRVSLMSTHTRPQLDRVVEILKRLGKKHGLIS